MLIEAEGLSLLEISSLVSVQENDKIPMKIKKVDQLPRTVNNKLKRQVGID